MQAIRDTDTERNAIYLVTPNETEYLCVARIKGIFFVSLTFPDRQSLVDFVINIEQYERNIEPLQNMQRARLYSWL